MNDFEKLNLDEKLLKTLHDEGFETPLEIQEKVIPLAVAGKDIIGKSETGSGKTLAFALPILNNLKPNKKVQALVLTPTRELAEQITRTFEKFSHGTGIEITSVYGGVNINTQMKKIPYSDIVVGTPGRIIDHLQRNTLELKHIKFLVLDEVDRMFDMGFYPDVEKILSKCPKERQTMLFSATISHDIDYLAKKHTNNAITVATSSYVDPTKLIQEYYDTPGNLKFSLLVHLLKEEKSNLVMVFCNTKRSTDSVARWLKKIGLNASAIHGDLTQNQRQRTLDNFHKKHINILVCTDVAARGLDIKGVSHVYNYDLPSKAEDYIHRVGRTARARKEGKAISILSDRDYESFDRILRANPNLKIERKEAPKIEVVKIEREFEQRRRFGGEDRSPRRDSRREPRGQGRGRFGDRDNRRRRRF